MLLLLATSLAQWLNILEECPHFLLMNPYGTLFFNATSVVVLNSHFRYLRILSWQEGFVVSYDHKPDLVLFKDYKMDTLFGVMAMYYFPCYNNQCVIGVVQFFTLFAHGCLVLLFWWTLRLSDCWDKLIGDLPE
ncbi:hypothetical protein QYE76_013299 [Lolium multiflorum]|uniref:Uncharacterized protein n=1 Tax=Lolium multiflorum TaxID=4521 RepID=A0AAD8X739_LOLMU|nr:hypothetical protein QYE76_013299 [Lolium multiflorum]